MIAILWRFEVRPEAQGAFERAYGPEGDWAALFRRGRGYLGTELLRGPAGSWLTIDRWRSRADFDSFMAASRADYEALDSATQGWTTEECKLGVWEAIPAPASPEAS
jgi:heme-degrading monooxygenase HmoA